MIKQLLLLGLAGGLSLTTSRAQAQVALTGSSYTQNFNSLPTTGTANAKSTLPAGWDFVETGSSADATYAINNGSNNAGNTYSFGATGNINRALGTLQSGSVVPVIGAGFSNTTGASLTGLALAYTGQTWRIGTANRTDKLSFQYSTDATSLTTGTWVDVTALDYTNTASATASTAASPSRPVPRSGFAGMILTLRGPTMAWPSMILR
jgi:hypothetical protein